MKNYVKSYDKHLQQYPISLDTLVKINIALMITASIMIVIAFFLLEYVMFNR
ncbi:MAG: hypothetical protein J6M62_09980 [Selenomonadaceae bacterium]|nr:hypothetical protein [Selenomonadaceae bacterium]MBP3722607.1 hypothetical protein [Selenomonadaceae bacterium]